MTETPQHDRVHTENLRNTADLRRSTTDRKIAGVAGGLGRHLNIDPTILRVLFVVLCFFGGAGFVLYGAAWLLIPEEGRENGVIETNSTARTALLIGAGVVAAFLLIGDSWGGLHFPWPLAVLALVVFVILMNRDKPMNNQPPPQPTGPDVPAGPPAADAGATTATMAPVDAPTEYGPQPPAPPWTPPTQQQPYQPPQPRPDRGALLFGPTLALVALALGVLGLYDAAGGSVTGSAYPALALAVVGGMLVVGSWLGRAGGLVLLGLVAAFALVVSSVANGNWSRTWHGDRVLAAAPFSAARVHDRYALPAGQIRLDLSQVRDPAALDGREVDVHANAGEIIVTLPPDVGADIQADVSGPGDITVAGRDTGGISPHVDRTVGPGPGSEAAHLTLNLDLAVGHIEVRQS